MKKVNIFLLSAIAFYSFLNSGCADDTKRPIPDISHIPPTNVRISRSERGLLALDTLQIKNSIEQFKAQYGTFGVVYLEQIMGFADPNKPDLDYSKKVSGLVNFPAFRHLADTVQIAYKDLASVERDLNDAFRFYKYYFPKRPVPKVYSCISEYSIGAFTIGDSIMGLGLDLFLGDKYPIYRYPPLSLPAFVTTTLDRDHLPAYAMGALVEELVGTPRGGTLLDVMVNNGKKIYILERLMPNAPDSLRMNYTAKQTDWCYNNERDMWAFFLDQKLLYSTNQREFRKFTEPSPTSAGMPAESPGRTANFMGYRIIDQFMGENPNMTLDMLLRETDAKRILTVAKFKPHK